MLSAVRNDPDRPPAAKGRQRPLVLLVDDCDDTRMLYSEYLDMSGFDVAEASDGMAAIATACSALPDIVVMDLGLPGLDGREAVRRLKTDPRTSTIPVVVVSGFSPNAGDPGEERPPWDAYVVKPCVPEDLVQTIGRVLGD
jgi:two-component system cell cycle response regulator DivK